MPEIGEHGTARNIMAYHNSGAAGEEAEAADDLSSAYEGDARNASADLSALDVEAFQESNLRWNWTENSLAAGKATLQEKQKGEV